MAFLKAGILVVLFNQLINVSAFGGVNYVFFWSENNRDAPVEQQYSGIHVVELTRFRRDVPDNTDHKPRINSLQMTSRIASRFAETVIESELENDRNLNVEAEFVVQIPETAFISNFSMIIDGIEYVADVKSKEDAQKEYDEAVKQNKTAGQVAQKPRTPLQAERGYELFTVSVNVQANSAVQFELKYQELLHRKYGLYENRISVRPNQIVQDLRADIFIYEPQGIAELDVIEPTFSNSLANQDTEIISLNNRIKEIHYQPSPERQEILNSEDGISGDLVVRYDVYHDNDIGLIQIEDGYFVHFFSPNEENLQVLGKNIIFVIDISVSMLGKKIEQTRDAMLTILDQLNNDDRFMIILFDDRLEYWPSGQELISVSSDSISRAKTYVRNNLQARGSTGINMALVEACGILEKIGSVRGKDMLIFLTDGQPTDGETRPSAIVENVVGACGQAISIFSLGFGMHLNYELLQSLAYRTKGFAKRIYEAADADVQLEDFFKEISLPLIYDVEFNYPAVAVDQTTVTRTSFAQFFKGSELVIAGQIADPSVTEWDVYVTGKTTNPYEIARTVDTTTIIVPPLAANAVTSNFIERLYVYIKIKDLLKEELITDNAEEKESIHAYALQLALDYKLVTPLTSMIIVQKDPIESVDEDFAYDMGRGSSGVKVFKTMSGSASQTSFVLLYEVWFAMLVYIT